MARFMVYFKDWHGDEGQINSEQRTIIEAEDRFSATVLAMEELGYVQIVEVEEVQ